MGVQIESETGVSVSVLLSFDNLSRIINLLDIPNLRVYVSGYGENSDEVRDFIYEEDDLDINYDVLDELSQANNEEEYNKKYNEMELEKDIEFHFMRVCTAMYTENLCYRNINRLFEATDSPNSALDLINSIQESIEVFKNHNIPIEQIHIGHTMREG
jgi:hypothetical protein